MLINELIERLEKVRAASGNVEVKIPIIDEYGSYNSPIGNFDYKYDDLSGFVLLSE